jgi:flagellar biogenesis protein FliO
MTGGPPEIGVAAFAVVGALLVVLGVAQWWLRRGVGARPGPIRVVATCGLGGKRSLALVEVEEARFLLGLTDDGIACLGRLGGGGATADAAGRLRAVAGGGGA